MPRYRQRLRRVPFDLVAPAWVDDPDFDIRWHVRNTALPAPGGRGEIERLLSRVMSHRMDRNRPLWEYWFCEGLADGRWGLLSKLHHSMVDGVSGSDLYHLLLDPSPSPGPAVPDSWVPIRPASVRAFTARAVLELAQSPVKQSRRRHGPSDTRPAVPYGVASAQGLLNLRQRGAPGAPHILDRPP